jgi:alpha-N-arabinofuranosidase
MKYLKLMQPKMPLFLGVLLVLVGLCATVRILFFNATSASNYSLYGADRVVTFVNPQITHTKTTIISQPLSKSSPISPYDFGVNNVWYDNGYGTANPTTEQPYNTLVDDTKQIGVNIIRYPGGNPSDLFNWENAIGPQASRKPSVIDGGRTYHATAIVPSTYGPNEFGMLLDKTGAAGDITVNFGTGSAAEAADWVCYETAPLNDTHDPACDNWAALRARDGHSKPYTVLYWEVGNEPNLAPYWRDGKVVSSPGNCQTSNVECLYVYGGTTSFSNQKLVYLQSQTSTNAMGPPAYMIANPPVIATSVVLRVQLPLVSGGYAPAYTWQAVPADKLATYHLSDRVYSLDAASGIVRFPTESSGIGMPGNAIVTVSYESGPHDGFISYYQQMKAANPAIHVCETYPSTYVLQLLGSKYPYDCYVIHDYGLLGGNDLIGGMGDNYSAQQFHDQLMLSAEILGNTIASVHSELGRYTGKNSKNVQVVMSEYGILNYEHPHGVDTSTGNSFASGSNYHSSLDAGIYAADMLRNIIDNGVSVAEKHYLVGYDLSPAPGVQSSFDSHDFASNAMIDTNDPACDNTGKCATPFFLLTPTAYIFEAFSKLSYGRLVDSTINDDPERVITNSLADTNNYPDASTGAYAQLQSLVTTDGKGDESMLVINSSATQSLLANVHPATNHDNHIQAWTIGAASYLAYNTQSDPDLAGLATTATNYSGHSILTRFPASSVSVLHFTNVKLTKQSLAQVFTPEQSKLKAANISRVAGSSGVSSTTTSPEASNPTSNSSGSIPGSAITTNSTAHLSSPVRTDQTSSSAAAPLNSRSMPDRVVLVKYFIGTMLLATNTKPTQHFYLNTTKLPNKTYDLETVYYYASGATKTTHQLLTITNPQSSSFWSLLH